ncbi:hypothetical protein OFO94_36155, partial [Escherichia coli]|nr:hypothetical protein [Escherichia coli]
NYMKLEPRLVRLVTTITEYQCDDCKESLMVKDKRCGSIQLTNPPKFKHICTQCESVLTGRVFHTFLFRFSAALVSMKD